jgi:hypothetical protein
MSPVEPHSPRELAVILDGGEARALADIVRALPAAMAQTYGASIWQQEGVSSVCLPVGGGTWLNHVIGLGLHNPATVAFVDAIVARHRQQEVPFVVKINPFAQPEELRAWLEARGVAQVWKQCKLGRDLQEPIEAGATDLVIRQIGTEQAEAFAEIVVAVFGMSPLLRPVIAATVGRPGWHHFMAFAEATPTATGALCRQGETGWLGMDATLPAFRRRGGQRAIIAARAQAAAEAGCRWLTTDTRPDTPENPNPSLRNMRRNRFFLAYERDYWGLDAGPST